MYLELLKADTTHRDLSCLRRGVSGGDAIPGEIIKEFEEKFPNCVILEGYGLSETASTTSFNVNAEERKVRSIGKPIWGVEVRIVDLDDKPLPPGPGNIGEVTVRGHNVMKGYYKNPTATMDTFHGGWFHTGDLAYVDDDGFLFIVDRKKDLIIRGGFNVYPLEIEDVLYEHPAIAEAAVIGRPDERLGEEVGGGGSRPEAGRDRHRGGLVGVLQGAGGGLQVPHERCGFLDELPKGPTGKILKKEATRELSPLRDRADLGSPDSERPRPGPAQAVRTRPPAPPGSASCRLRHSRRPRTRRSSAVPE